MHKMALLKAEVNELREANATLSKRRRAKKTRLRQGGSVTIADGQALRGQKGAAQQAEQDTNETGGEKQQGGTEQRRCGMCGEPGHNAKNCQITVKISYEEDGSGN